jgi:hypothetical protein
VRPVNHRFDDVTMLGSECRLVCHRISLYSIANLLSSHTCNTDVSKDKAIMLSLQQRYKIVVETVRECGIMLSTSGS